MHISNKEIRARARSLLDDNIFGKDWVKSVILNVLVVLVAVVVIMLLASITMTIFEFVRTIVVGWIGEKVWLDIFLAVLFFIVYVLIFAVVLGPLQAGLAAVHLELVNGSGEIKMRKFFDGFKNIGGTIELGLMYCVHILLWFCLFIIPAYYVSLSYAMIFHVKHENPEFSWKECFDESERLMEGNRWRYLKLIFSFFGWEAISSIAFFGWGSLWVTPYINVSSAVFYDIIKQEKEEEEEYKEYNY